MGETSSPESGRGRRGMASSLYGRQGTRPLAQRDPGRGGEDLVALLLECGSDLRADRSGSAYDHDLHLTSFFLRIQNILKDI